MGLGEGGDVAGDEEEGRGRGPVEGKGVVGDAVVDVEGPGGVAVVDYGVQDLDGKVCEGSEGHSESLIRRHGFRWLIK